MWEISGEGSAEFRANGWKLVVASEQSEGGGIRLLACREHWVGASARIVIPGYGVPSCAECFVRGDAFHMIFPISDYHPIGMELVMMAIEADQGMMIVESVIGLNTSLLDTNPSVDLELGAGHPGFPVWGRVGWEKLAEQADWVWMQSVQKSDSEGPSISTGLLCDGRDLCSLAKSDQDIETRVRFFGDFLEKGVIRKVQPWWVWSSGRLANRKVNEIARYLSVRPLALSN
jgi:hypothetical protein